MSKQEIIDPNEDTVWISELTLNSPQNVKPYRTLRRNNDIIIFNCGNYFWR